MQAVDAPLFKSVEDDLCIRVMSFPMPRPNAVEILTKLGVIVDLAVERNPEAPILIAHWLVCLRREVYDREPSVPQADIYGGVDPKAGAIRTSVNHLITQTREIRLRNLKAATLKSQDANYSAHKQYRETL
jgi:hypothetical protein